MSKKSSIYIPLANTTNPENLEKKKSKSD